MSTKKERPIKGWWFPHLQDAPHTKRSVPIIRHEAKNNPVELGGTLVLAGQVHHLSDDAQQICCCGYGLHASRNVGDAAFWATQLEIVCRVELWGEVNELVDKLAARNRRIVRVYRIPRRVMGVVFTALYGDRGKIILREIRRQDKARAAKKASKR